MLASVAVDKKGLAALSWDRAFDDPIILTDGRELVTLRDAGEHITALPKATQRKPEWALATNCFCSRQSPAAFS